MRRPRREGGVSPVFFYVLGAAALVIALFWALGSVRLAASAVHAEGELANVRTVSTGHGKNRAHTTYAELRFVDAEGRAHSASTKLGGIGQWHEGEHVDVIYPPGQPGRAQVAGFQNQWATTCYFGVGGLFLLLVGWLRSEDPQS